MENKKLAVVTGASNGIGKELAKLFAKDGYSLVIAGRDEERLAVTASELQALGAQQIHSFLGDLTDRSQVEALFQKIKSVGLPIDAVAINAGRGLGGRFATETSIEEELEIINLNITSTVLLAKLVVPDMVARGQGRILFTGSISGTTPVPFEAVYGGSKAFVNSFSHALRIELQGTGVTTTVLMPDATETDFFHHAHMEDTKVGSGPKQDVEVVAQEGYDALMSGRESVFGGDLMAKVRGRVMNSVLPDKLKERMAGHRSEPGGAKL